jgi:hypothetical protein
MGWILNPGPVQGGGVEARFTVALPAKGRTVLGQWALAILVQNLPRWVPCFLLYFFLFFYGLFGCLVGYTGKEKQGR